MYDSIFDLRALNFSKLMWFLLFKTLPQRPVAPPSPALSLRERVSSFKRLIVPGNKSTPDTPNNKEGSPYLKSHTQSIFIL